MSIKIIGAIIITLSSYILGLYFGGKLGFRNQDLEQLKKALTIYKGELLYSSLPIENVFDEISNRTDGVIAMLFSNVCENVKKRNGVDLSEIWNNGIVSIVNKTYLNKEDMEYMFSFGKTLGFSDKEQQANNAKLLIEYIEETQKTIRKEKTKEEKLYKALGVMFGLMVSIVLF